MNRVLLFVLYVLLQLPAAGQGGTLHIAGLVRGLPQARSVQLIYPNGYRIAGPVAIKDGQWSLRCRINQPQLALVSFLSDQPLGAKEAPVYRYNVPLFLSAGNVLVETSDTFTNSRVVGSEATEDYQRLQNAAQPYLDEINRWRVLAADSANVHNQERQVAIGRKVDSLMALCRERVYGRFLEHKIASPLVPHVLSAYWHLNGEPERMLHFLINMPWRYRYPYINAFRDELEQVARVWTGQDAPDFTLRDTSGKAITLSSLRGRYVFIDFWSAWNADSRLEHGNLGEALAYFRPRGLTVLGVALQQQRGDEPLWRRAVRADSLGWTQVVDFRGLDAPVAKKYKVLSLPQNVLVDPSGRIVARNLYGEHLWAELDRILPR